MQETDTGLRAAARAAATSIAASSLLLAGGVLGWFAYVDAPITDGAMGLVALGVLCAVLAVAAALWARELLLAPVDGPVNDKAAVALARATLLRRIALGLLLAALLLLAGAALLTLNLRGSGDDDAQDTRTTRYAPRIAASSASTCSGRWS